MSTAADFLSDSDLAWWDEPAQPEQHCAGAAVPLGEDGSKRCAFREVPVGNTSPTACALAATCGMRKQVLAGEDEWQTVLVRRTDGEAPVEDAAFWDAQKAKARKDMAKKRTARMVRAHDKHSAYRTQWGGTQTEWAANRPTLARVAEAVRELSDRAPAQWAPAIRRLSGMPKNVGEAQRWTGATEAIERLAGFDEAHGDALNWVLSDEDIKHRAAELAQHVAERVARIYLANGADLREATRVRAQLQAHDEFTAATSGKTAAQVRRDTGRALDLWARAAALTPAQIDGANAMLERLKTAMHEAVEFIDSSCRNHQVDPPQLARRVLQHEAVQGAIERAKDPQWWRRQLRKAAARIVEAGAIKLGMVNRRTGGYCSDWALQQRRDQLRRNANNLANTLVRNEAGQLFSLAELAAASVSNPVNRGGELMTRIRGCEEYADAAGHVGLFVTLTCPSAMHKILSQEWRDKGDTRNTADAYKARPNPRYDGVSTPRSAQQWLVKQWAKVRTKLARQKLQVYGFRVAEPHHDGTPHWHALIWVKNAAEAARVQAILFDYWVNNDPVYAKEKGAADYRTNVKLMEKGGAAGYIAKYIAKSIGHHALAEHVDNSANGELFTVEMGGAQGHERVDAWASRWGIRQFQAIGQPSVTVWREVRRVTEDQVRALDWSKDATAKLAWDAAQKIGDKPASWADYLQAIGGVCLRRDQYRLQPACRTTSKANKYGEQLEDRKVVGVRTTSGKWLVSRRQHWVPVTGEAAALAKARIAQGETPQESATRTALAVPWTGFNNCTARRTQGHANWLWEEAETLAKAEQQAEENALIAKYLAPIYADQLQMFGATPESIAQAAPLHATELLGALGMTRAHAIACMQRDGWLQAPRQYAEHAPIPVPQTTPELDAAIDAMAEALGF